MPDVTTVTTGTTPTAPITFSMAGTALLASGQSMSLLARTPRLWIHSKVYAEGGENALHNHPAEDHAFFVLDGEATFVDAEGVTRVAARHEGLMVPRGVSYTFRSTGETNLVMLRIGADASEGVVAAALEDEQSPDSGTYPLAQSHRAHADGAEFPPTDPANRDGALDPTPLPGQFFGG